MSAILSITFLGIEFAFIVLSVLAILRTGFVRLNSAIGIARDGFPPGEAVPHWSLPDSEGHLRVTPAGDHWQFLIFTDHSLISFPDLIDGIKHLAQQNYALEVLILSRDDKELCKAVAQGLDGLVPVVPVDQTFYDRFRVRVIPFAFLLDRKGVLHWVGLASTAAQLSHAWYMTSSIDYVSGADEEG